MKRLFFLIGVMLFLVACQSKDQKKYISIPSLVEAQVAHVDSSLYSITKYIYKGTDTIPADTVYIRREEFRQEAAEFLDILDLSLSKNANRFKEESRYDELLERVILTYLPLDANNEEWQKEEIMVKPDPATGDKVTTIIASKVRNNRNGLLQLEMLWLLDRSFQITRTSQLPGEQSVITTAKVIWNDYNDYDAGTVQ
ncbi:MAG: hypothetical protein EB025_06965 [Chitinophagaceae bacterium]|nr:hypothetical protein [Chitinophagaceae bacterium]